MATAKQKAARGRDRVWYQVMLAAGIGLAVFGMPPGFEGLYWFAPWALIGVSLARLLGLLGPGEGEEVAEEYEPESAPARNSKGEIPASPLPTGGERVFCYLLIGVGSIILLGTIFISLADGSMAPLPAIMMPLVAIAAGYARLQGWISRLYIGDGRGGGGGAAGPGGGGGGC